MTENDYSGMVEPWKVHLAITRARQMGFRGARLDDALQELAPVIARFKHDPAKAHGGEGAAALRVLVRRRLSNIIRREQRAKKKERQAPVAGVTQDPIPAFELACDVRVALSSLPPAERAVCDRLGRGESQKDIAAALHITRDVLRTRMDHIRLHFLDLGIDAWVCGQQDMGEEQP